MSEETTAPVAVEAAAPVEAPAPVEVSAPAEAPVEAAPAAEPEDRFWENEVDWSGVNPSSEDWLESFDERVRPFVKGSYDLRQSEIDSIREDKAFISRMYDSALDDDMSSPAHKELATKLTAAEEAATTHQSRIAELEAELLESRNGYEEYRGGKEAEIVDKFIDANISAIKAASPEDISMFQVLAGDLGDPKDDRYNYLDTETAWRIVQAGMGDKVVQMHKDGVPASYINTLLDVVASSAKKAAPAPAPSPAPRAVPAASSARVVSGADSGARGSGRVASTSAKKRIAKGDLRSVTNSVLDKYM
tara:strand:- start:2339 stop:3253 length:915 start_codon:yes stop_codon:yes gene_type:complete